MLSTIKIWMNHKSRTLLTLSMIFFILSYNHVNHVKLNMKTALTFLIWQWVAMTSMSTAGQWHGGPGVAPVHRLRGDQPLPPLPPLPLLLLLLGLQQVTRTQLKTRQLKQKSNEDCIKLLFQYTQYYCTVDVWMNWVCQIFNQLSESVPYPYVAWRNKSKSRGNSTSVCFWNV